jgi:crossover junction endodeoxyribonuclease RuvC
VVKIIGIDPGLADTGVGVITGCAGQVAGFAYGSVHTPAGIPLPDRLHRIHTRLSHLVDDETPDLMVVEDVFSLKQYPKSGITLGKVTGVILLTACRQQIPVIEIPVREAKQVLTGNGNAGKDQLERSVRRLLKLASPIKPSHASDALALALIGLFRYADPLPPKRRREPRRSVQTAS